MIYEYEDVDDDLFCVLISQQSSFSDILNSGDLFFVQRSASGPVH